MILAKEKRCPQCKMIKAAEFFHRSTHHKDGLAAYCKECSKFRARTMCREKTRQQKKLYYQSARGRASHLKLAARKRGIASSFTLEEFEEWYGNQPKRCVYCNARLSLKGGHNSTYSVSIDRMDNNGIYELSNMVLCCRRCNRVKSDVFSYNQMVEIGKRYLWVTE